MSENSNTYPTRVRRMPLDESHCDHCRVDFHMLPEGRAATSCRRLFRCLTLTSQSCLLALEHTHFTIPTEAIQVWTAYENLVGEPYTITLYNRRRHGGHSGNPCRLHRGARAELGYTRCGAGSRPAPECTPAQLSRTDHSRNTSV